MPRTPFYAWLDPNDDEGAEPIDPFALAALLLALSVSLWMFLRWKFQPMQDLGHHLALSAVVSDWGRQGSLYTELYEPIDPLAANSLLYLLAGYAGRAVGVTAAVRVAVALYLAGVPLANLYALRVFGRSAWGAVLAVPLVYTTSFVAGFANMLFAAPFMVLAVPVYYRALREPSYRRMIPAAMLFVIVFLCHAHVFLWLGVLALTMTLAMGGTALTVREDPCRARFHALLTLGISALACVLPSLLLFFRWYARSFGQARASGGVLASTSTASEGFGASYRPVKDLFENLGGYVFKTFTSDQDLIVILLVVVLVAVALSLSRAHAFEHPPVLELCCGLTLVSYFFLPEGLSGHDVLGTRQPGIALWFLPAVISPVPLAVSRVRRSAVVFGILAITVVGLYVWHDNLALFERDEIDGLGDVLAAAPPRLRMHYVKMSPGSLYFTWNPLWHVDKFYMSDALGTVPDTPGILSTSAVRFRASAKIHRITEHDDDWPFNEDIWRFFDLVLVHDWEPDEEDSAEAAVKGLLLAKSGKWELWRTRPHQRDPSLMPSLGIPPLHDER